MIVACRRWLMGMFCNACQGEIFLDVVGGKQFLDDDDLVMHLGEAHEEIAVRGGGVDLVAQFLQGGLGGLQPFRRGKGDQGRACPWR